MDWKSIDGFLKEEDAKVIEAFVHSVSGSGWIIEIGSFKGRQSAFIAQNKNESAMLTCIDPFPAKLVNFDDSRTYQNYMFRDWTENLSAFKNVEAVRGTSPFNISFIKFTKVPDLIIFDVDEVYESLQFWAAHIDKNTVIIVHTYKHEHDRIVSQLLKAQNELGFSIEYKNSLAILKRKDSQR